MHKNTLAVTAALLFTAAPLVATTLFPGQARAEPERAPSVTMYEIGQTVLKMGLAEGVTPDAAIEAMNSKAVELNMKLVGHQNVGAELQARGIDSPRLEIYQFCRPEDAVKMVQFNTIYAAYMPCRIALVEDDEGNYWLEMLNLDMIINAYELPPELQAIAITINGEMLSILTAGATGAF
ncbi:DUF302 domain-containing protein [Thiohalocapsa marina]|uniref:DUF302 domain-containing protein n=1 Tax=Thiohalocapsa marina TaxID=424902 RepID=A0A5M8FLP9_9GAMM|nr:DUF302 domain-containing protein [Thiohalocapsa marina]KAA6184930.1 DUF302 domain-containing protein [Thiohalocapsa marina]